MSYNNLKEFQVLGRRQPTEADPKPAVYRMRLFAPNAQVAKSRFWYFLSKQRKLKKSDGEVLSVTEIFEKKPTKVKNFAVWLRYNSRSGTHNMYKEFRDLSRAGAIEQLYVEMASRHRTRPRDIHVVQTATVKAKALRRTQTKQFIDPKIKFPLPHIRHRVADRQYKKTFAPFRPNTFQ